MNYLEYQIKTLAPVIISQTSGDANITNSLDFINGSTLLGCFASRYIKKANLFKEAHLDPQFYNWFLQGSLTFGNGYHKLNNKGKYIQLTPTPLSIHAFKVGKRLVNLASEEVEESTKAAGGYCSLSSEGYFSGSPEKNLNFHQERDRGTGSSKEGRIFNYESIGSGQVFGGLIEGSREELLKFKEVMGESFISYLGRSRNTQYGRVEITLSEVKEDTREFEIEEDLVLTFTSPVILINKYGYPDTNIEVLKDYLDQFLGKFEYSIEKVFSRVSQIENFVAVWTIKKPIDKAFVAGTTLKLNFPYGISEEIDEKVRKLLQEGLGERRNEGFGKISLLPKDKINNWSESTSKIPSKPEGVPPQLFKEIIYTITLKEMEKGIQLKARQVAQDFLKETDKKRISSSALGRLELMLKALDSREFLRQVTETLRGTAKDKLKVIRNKHNTLAAELKTFNTEELVNQQLSSRNEWTKLIKECSLDVTTPVIMEQMYKSYWLTFFRTMRKSKTFDERGGE